MKLKTESKKEREKGELGCRGRMLLVVSKEAREEEEEDATEERETGDRIKGI